MPGLDTRVYTGVDTLDTCGDVVNTATRILNWARLIESAGMGLVPG